MKIKVSNVNTPNWKEVTVKSRIPVELERLSEIARNIWWAWNFEATELFRDLDPELWKECGQNPVLLLQSGRRLHLPRRFLRRPRVGRRHRHLGCRQRYRYYRGRYPCTGQRDQQ